LMVEAFTPRIMNISLLQFSSLGLVMLRHVH
jgi:hypothetical protein